MELSINGYTKPSSQLKKKKAEQWAGEEVTIKSSFHCISKNIKKLRTVWELLVKLFSVVLTVQDLLYE